MKLDKLFTIDGNRNRTETKVHNIGKGRVSGFLINHTNVVDADYITVKIRGEKNTVLSANRFSLAHVENMTAENYGYSSRVGVAAILEGLYNKQKELTTATTGIDDLQSFFKDYMASSVKPIYFDLGHVNSSLMNIEITIETENTATDSPFLIDCYAVHMGNQPDVINQYDETTLSDIVQKNILEIYYKTDSADKFVSPDGVFRQLQFQIDAEKQTFLSDTIGAIGISTIMGKYPLANVNSIALYKETSPIQGDARIKVTGDVRSSDTILIKRRVYPEDLSNSTKENLIELKEDVEKLERENAELAKKMRHSGEIVKSEELAEALREITESEKDDKAEKSN